ncbi:MAG TPA: serine/threonine-protein kinase [Dermatophilaceae bacterium]
MLVDGAHAQNPVGEPDAPEGYEDLERIDQGGFATVYRARDIRFDRTVALKVLRSDTLNDRQLRRFRAECLATGRVSSHPNIVTVYGAGTTRGHRPWLAMEYCSGGSLARKVAAQGPLPVSEVVSIGARLCSALHAAHEAGVLHRDVKPHNVLLTAYGEPALADFGIASVVTVDDTGSVATETAAYTVVHAAPEILEGRAATAASDIYSLGSTLYTLLAGQAPFAKEARTGLAPLVSRILRNDLPAIARPGVPPELEQLLRRCMAAEPHDRPASAVELGVSLNELGQGLTTVASARRSPEPTLDTPAISSRRRFLVLCGALAALLAVSTAWRLAQPATDPDQMSSSHLTATAAQAAARYTPRNAVVAQGPDRGELIVSWAMPIRPDVVATVIYEGADASKARAIVNYDASPNAAPWVALRGLPSGQQTCLSVAHLVSPGDVVTFSHPVCAAAR